MTNKRIVMVFLFLAAAVNMPMAAARAQDKPATEVQWRTDYPAARKEALEKQRPILILCEEPNSIYCFKFKRDTFGNADVIKLLNADFIPLSIDMDKQRAQ